MGWNTPATRAGGTPMLMPAYGKMCPGSSEVWAIKSHSTRWNYSCLTFDSFKKDTTTQTWQRGGGLAVHEPPAACDTGCFCWLCTAAGVHSGKSRQTCCSAMPCVNASMFAGALVSVDLGTWSSHHLHNSVFTGKTSGTWAKCANERRSIAARTVSQAQFQARR